MKPTNGSDAREFPSSLFYLVLLSPNLCSSAHRSPAVHCLAWWVLSKPFTTLLPTLIFPVPSRSRVHLFFTRSHLVPPVLSLSPCPPSCVPCFLSFLNFSPHSHSHTHMHTYTHTLFFLYLSLSLTHSFSLPLSHFSLPLTLSFVDSCLPVFPYSHLRCFTLFHCPPSPLTFLFFYMLLAAPLRCHDKQKTNFPSSALILIVSSVSLPCLSLSLLRSSPSSPTLTICLSDRPPR